MKAVMRYRRNGVAAVGIALLLAAVLGLAAQNLATLPGQVGSRTAPSAGVASPALLSRPDEATRTRLSQAYGKLPLHFEANRGQAGSQVRFLSRGSGYSLFLTPTEAVLRLRQGSKGAGVVVHMHFLGAHPAPQLEGLEPIPGKSRYFIGNDPSRWHIGIPHYARVRYPGIYPGIDLVFYGNQRRLEYDFVVAPGADPRAIRLEFEGTDRLGLDEEGNLVLHTAGGQLLQRAPAIYQEVGGTRRAISGRYVLFGGKGRASEPGIQEVGFKVAAYDPARPLVIDPMLEYSTYLGGSGNEVGIGIAVDTSGNAYVTGSTSSANFPTAHPIQPARGGNLDVFVTKLNPEGSALVYSTYLGGSGNEVGNSIAVDTSGNAYVIGYTESANFPTAHPIQPARGGGSDAFVVKLNPEGSALAYSTYLGGRRDDVGKGIAVDSSGNAFATGNTKSSNFPTVRPIQPALDGDSDAFVVKLNPEGSARVYSTYLGGSSDEFGYGGIAVDSFGSAYVTGGTSSTNFPTKHPIQPTYGGGGGFEILNSDAFVAKLSPEGSALVYSTYLGGNGGEIGFGIAVDSSGNAYVAGGTSSTNFPTKHPIQPAFGGGLADAFVAKLNPEGSALVYSTYLGGSGDDGAFGITVDTSGNACMAGGTRSPNFPTARPIQPALDGDSDAFVVKLNPEGSALVYSTYLGGNGRDNSGFGIAVDSSGNVYVTGVTPSRNFPTAHPFQRAYGGGSSDAFIAKIGDAGPTEPLFSVTPSSLDFGRVTVGGSADRALTVQNTGGGTLTGSVSTSAPYSVVSGGSYSLAGGQSQSVTVRFSPTADGTFPGSVTFTGGGGTVTVTGTGVTRVLVHDLAVTKITAPKMITLTAKKPARTVQVKVQIQNRSPHDEILQDMGALSNVVSLTVESLGSCPAPTPVLHTGSPQRALPLTLKPKQTLAVVFDVTFDCANDRFKSTPASPGHEDYRYIAAVDHAAIDGEADSHPADDTCPRSVTPPFETDPYPDGKIKDRGCGGQKPDRTFGADILMDVVVK